MNDHSRVDIALVACRQLTTVAQTAAYCMQNAAMSNHGGRPRAVRV